MPQDIPGVYKYYSQDLSRLDDFYEGCTDAVSVLESMSAVNESISQSVSSYLAESLAMSEFRVFSELLSLEASRVDSNSNLVLNCYNIDDLDDELIYKVSSLYDINYPLDYDVNKLKLIFKNYEKIRKLRGDKRSIYMLLRLIDRTEADLYEDDYDETVITEVSEGFYEITNPRIVSNEFAKYMLTKVVRSGVRFTFNGI